MAFISTLAVMDNRKKNQQELYDEILHIKEITKDNKRRKKNHTNTLMKSPFK